MKCWYCGVELTSANQSLEHIIPDSLGGRIRSRELLCKDHNSLLGNSVDSELYNQLKSILMIINPVRDRPYKGMIKGRDEKGQPLTVAVGLRDTHEITIVFPNGNEVSLVTDSKEKLEGMIAKKIREIRAKDPLINIRRNNYRQEDRRHLTLYNTHDATGSKYGDFDFLRAVLKIVVNFYLYKGEDKKYLDSIIMLIKGEGDLRFKDRIRFYYPPLPVHEMSENEISHLLYIKGDAKGNLFAYVELLSFLNLFIVIDTDYKGPVFTHHYCYDLVSCKEINSHIDIDKPNDFLMRFAQFTLAGTQNAMTDMSDRLMSLLEKNQHIFRNR